MYYEESKLQPGDFWPELQDTVHMFESEIYEGETETDVAIFVDPRCPELGVRFLCSNGGFELDSEEDEDSIKKMDDVTEYT